MASVKAFVIKWWKLIVGAIGFCFVLYEKLRLNSLEVASVEAKANAVDAGLAQKQADVSSSIASETASAAKAEADVSSETATQVAKDLNGV